MEGEFRSKFNHLETSLKQIPHLLEEKPRAVLVITAHWQTAEISVSSNPHPSMIYDYGGFPEQTYKITYPAPGSPELAEHISQLINESGICCKTDPNRGFDHGTFVPMSVIFPDADLPIVQLSIHRDNDPALHLALGRALSTLRNNGVLIIGSGLSYHNLQNFGPMAKQSSKEFDDWLQQTLCHSAAKERINRLLAWEQAPSARQAHPDEDHLLPLMVTVGAAETEQATCIYHEEDFFAGISVSGFRFG